MSLRGSGSDGEWCRHKRSKVKMALFTSRDGTRKRPTCRRKRVVYADHAVQQWAVTFVDLASWQLNLDTSALLPRFLCTQRGRRSGASAAMSRPLRSS